jgi:RecA/RadA recombinase
MLITGNKELDKYFNYSTKINCIYGKAATGKTNFCHLIASKVAETKKVLFIDTEKSFSPERIGQLTDKDVLKNIIVVSAKDFSQQHKTILNLPNLKHLINLVIIDSLSMHYRKELQEKNPEANPMLSKQFNILSELTSHNIPVIFTSQVYDRFDNTIEPIGSNMVRNWSSCIIKLEYDNERKLTLEKHPILRPTNFSFIIKNSGIYPKI